MSHDAGSGHPHHHDHHDHGGRPDPIRKPRKQEQEPAQRTVTELAPGVLRMQLPITMPGLGHVNMYALVDSQGVALVDPGLPTPGTWSAIRDRLRQAGLQPRHVHTVIVTHSHPDHFGGAARLARASRAAVVAHRSFRFGVVQAAQDPEVSVEDLAGAESGAGAASGSGDDLQRRILSFRSRPTPWGGQHPRPPFAMRMRWRLARWLGRAFVPVITKPVRAGDVLRLGGREWLIRHTPGHTEDHICLHDPADGLYLSGDHVLPTITPHISGLAAAKDPLATFFESLDQAAATPDVKLVLPAHGHPFTDLAGRCEAIKRHHHERLEKVKHIGRELGPATVQAFSQRLFHPRSWGEMAESETYAHLEHLRLAGAAACHRNAQGFLIYETG
jgi:glyoxylase-like metal-dependent hydrolase (beta-lactamase superfamily II)